eukprot:2149828-Pyramimonas_sp.AAC.1
MPHLECSTGAGSIGSADGRQQCTVGRDCGQKLLDSVSLLRSQRHAMPCKRIAPRGGRLGNARD